MSSDLLKEFAAPRESLQHQGPAPEPADTTDPEEDDFGDFEDPEEEGNLINSHSAAAGISPNKEVEWDDFEDQSSFFHADQIISKQKEHVVLARIPQQSFNKSKAASQKAEAVVYTTPNATALGEAEVQDWPETSQDPIIPTKATTSNTIPEPKSSYKSADSGPPPSNVPPPSVLLPLVTTVFRSLAADVKMVISSGFVSSDHPSVLDQAKVYQIKDALATARAGARIIAGRKLRWKRDNLLSQSMKIGPATGRPGGMKLAGLDKTESRREDAEAAEAVRVWKQQVGGLRSAVTTANLRMTVPEISEAMPIRVVKASEGAVIAFKCCFLCGVKRDERVAKVDVNVEDSFGEWWIEHWGHLDCATFWTDHKGSLGQR